MVKRSALIAALVATLVLGTAGVSHAPPIRGGGVQHQQQQRPPEDPKRYTVT